LKDEINWEMSILFAGISEHLMPIITQLCHEKGENNDYGGPCDGFLLRNLTDLVELPEDPNVEAKALDWNKYGQLVADHWKYDDDQTALNSKELFSRGLMMGIFVKGELASWFCTTR